MSLASSILDLPAYQGAASFFTWWKEELLDILPDTSQARSDTDNRADIRLSKTQVEIDTQTNYTGEKLVADCSFFDLDEEGWSQIAEISAYAQPRLYVAAEDIFTTEINLPKSAIRYLSQTLGLQLQNRLPLKLEVLDWGYAPGPAENDMIPVSIVAAKSAKLDAIDMEFAEHGLMPPIICTELDDQIITLRTPLYMGPDDNQKLMRRAILAAIAMICFTPLVTIGTASALTAMQNNRAELLEQEVRPRLETERRLRSEEAARRAARPLFSNVSASTYLENLARLLPVSAWIVDSQQSPDGGFEFIADMENRDEVEAALGTSKELGNFEVMEEIPVESERSRIRYRVRPL